MLFPRFRFGVAPSVLPRFGAWEEQSRVGNRVAFGTLEANASICLGCLCLLVFSNPRPRQYPGSTLQWRGARLTGCPMRVVVPQRDLADIKRLETEELLKVLPTTKITKSRRKHDEIHRTPTERAVLDELWSRHDANLRSVLSGKVYAEGST